ncbi:MAG TPA: O-antigen ligase family protein [Chloroflexota bacterium]|nr:O-antigen ligase family protein [Chloroflexota bacterium]
MSAVPALTGAPAAQVGEVGQFGPRRRGISPWLALLPLGLALALLPPFFTFPIVAGLAGAAVLLANPRWALYLLALSVPYQSGFRFGEVGVSLDIKLGQVNVSVTEGVVLILLVGWVSRLAAGRAPRPALTPLVAAVAFLLTGLALSALVASDLALASKEMLKWVELAAVYLAGTSLLETRAHRRTLLVWLLAAATSQALVGLFQSVRQIGPEHFAIGGVLMRAYGTFEQPNPFGGYLGLHLPLAVALVCYGLRPGNARRLALLAGGTIGAALLLTLSRGAWTAQAVALLVVILAGSRTARHMTLTFGVLAAILGVAVWPLLPVEITARAVSVVGSAFDLSGVQDANVTPENWAVMERLSQWFAGWQMFRANPLLGVGIGNYNAAYDDYRLDQWPLALGHAHNHYLTVAAEAGFLGFLGYVVFLAFAFRSAVSAFRYHGRLGDRQAQAVALGILGGLTAYATHNLFDVMFVHGMGVTVGLLLALLYVPPQEPASEGEVSAR